MKHLAAIFLLLAAAAAYGQTVKTLGYNTTNGEVVYTGTNALTFPNGLGFSTNAAATTRTNLGLGWSALTNTNAGNFRAAISVAPAPIFRVLTNDFAITNQTNFVTVDGLTLPTEAGKHYVVQLSPIISSVNRGVHQIAASNATVYGFWISAFGVSGPTNPLTNEQASLITDQRNPVQPFYVVGGTNAGSISFQFRSDVDTNTNTIHAGSFILAQEVAPQ